MSHDLQFYRCDTSEFGALQLVTSLRDTAVAQASALLDAQVLHELETLTQSLENLLRCPLDWQNMASDKNASCESWLELELQLSSSRLLANVTLEMPHSLLPVLQHWRVDSLDGISAASWKPVAVTVCLSKVRLSAEELANLDTGALFIIPESYEPASHCTLSLSDGAAVYAGQYQWTDDRLVLDSVQYPEHRKETSSADDAAVDAPCCLLFSGELAPTVLMASEIEIKLGAHTRQQESRLSLQAAGEYRFSGSLLPLGAGSALLIEQSLTAVH